MTTAAEMLALAALATPRPWGHTGQSDSHYPIWLNELIEIRYVNIDADDEGRAHDYGRVVATMEDGPPEDADLIIYAVNNIERVEQENARLREALTPFALSIRDDVPDDHLIDTVAWTAREHRAAEAALSDQGDGR